MANRTIGKITDILQPDDINKDTVSVLTNAAYFSAHWVNKFGKNATSEQPFFGFDGKTNVRMMMQKDNFNYYEEEKYQAVFMDYISSNLAMVIVLPKGKTQGDFQALEKMVNAQFVREMAGKLDYRELIFHLPRFETEMSSGLEQPLLNMGFEKALTPEAEFCGITARCGSNTVWIDNIVHKTFIEVDEDGTEAGAATLMAVVFGMDFREPKTFRADHPFIYFIYDKASGTILFMGRVMEF